MMTVADLFVYCGIVAVAVGAGMISLPFAFIVGGSFSVVAGVAMSMRRTNGEG